MAASLGHIERAGWHLLDLINEVLDLSRIEAGALSVSLEPVALAPLASECLRLSEPAAAKRSIALRLDDRVGGALAAQADRVRLRQVLMNLLSNAIKYNRDGGQVVLTLAADASGDGRVTLAVRDTGPGFTPAQREQLYEPFNRLGAENGTPGTGIGLVITRRLVELMHGTLSLQTAPGQGATFTVALPAAVLARTPALPAPHPASVAPGGASGPGRTLLYIEDNPSNVELVRDVMTLRPGLQLMVAGTGNEGLTLAHAVQPDLVLIDIGLPDIDGNEICRRLRADPVLGGRPLVALSANAMPADVARGAHAGFDAYLTKPLDVPGFLRQIDRLLEQAS
jgi:CheY-like chemotaxis protein/two-component sensor histidine kinase